MKKLDQKTYRVLLVALVVLLILAILLIVKCCRRNEQAASAEDVAGALVDMEEEEEREYCDEWIPPTDCSDGAQLFIANGPGIPEDASALLMPEEAPGSPGILAASLGGQNILALTVPPIKKVTALSLELLAPLSTEGELSSYVKVLNPPKGSKLEAGSSFTLRWEIDSGRNLKVEILFSADGGAKWSVIGKDPVGNSHTLTVPDTVSNNCLFRINARVEGTEILWYNLSPVFAVVAPAEPVQPAPPPTVEEKAEVEVLTPEKGSKLEAGSKLALLWKIKSEQKVKVEVLFSADGGAKWSTIAENLSDKSAYLLTVPNKVSNKCLFRVNAWAGQKLLGHNLSPAFRIVSPSQASEGSGEPLPPPLFTAEDGAFISPEGDAVRLLKIEHALKNVDSVVWQVGRINFPCGAALPFAEAPGLLAQGELPGDTREFKIDFGALLAGVEAGEAPAANEGAEFSILAKSLAFKRSQHDLYIRTVLLDKNKKVVGITRSDFQVIYGQSSLDTQTPPETTVSAGEFSIKEESGWTPGSFKLYPEQGVCLFAGYENKWTFMLDKIPKKAPHITYDGELQIATQPFADKYESDYLDPAGLVYRRRSRNTQVTQWFHVDCADFAPTYEELGQETIQYFIRAVCYLETDIPGTYIPIATPSYPLCYTGDFNLYLKKKAEAIPPPPVEVEVKSLVPYTRVVSYIPPQWAFKNAHEYLQVTRHIEAEELCFYIKNHKTGEFLYPYPAHFMIYPKTTPEEYQETLDRMLPRGANFHLTIKGPSGLAKLVSDFADLLKEIYQGIQSAYNGFKAGVANFIADRCSFLGETVQGYVRSGVKALLDYGLAYVGLPPSLPNFEELAKRGLGYCVEVALQEAAEAIGVPPEMIPDQAKEEIIAQVNAEFDELTATRMVNPFDVDYLKPSPEAMYRPPRVTLSFFNADKEEWSCPGTVYIDYTSGGGDAFSLFRSSYVTIPSLPPMSVKEIDVYLAKGKTITAEGFRAYYDGSSKDFTDLIVVATYHVPNIEEAAKEQGLIGTDPKITYLYEFDRDPVYRFKENTPANEPYYEVPGLRR